MLQIHRTRRSSCLLYHLPLAVTDGRIIQDWMISDDGCLVLCLLSGPSLGGGAAAAPTAAAPLQLLAEDKSVRSFPASMVGRGRVLCRLVGTRQHHDADACRPAGPAGGVARRACGCAALRQGQGQAPHRTVLLLGWYR